MLFVNLSQAPWIIGGVSVLIGLIVLSVLRRNQILKIFFSGSQRHMADNRMKGVYIAKIISLIIIAIMLALALLDPRGASSSSDVQMAGIDIVLTFDVSRSMDAQDVSPSRLKFAKNLGEQLNDMLVGNRIGLVAFAADAFRLLPLTTDIDSVNLFMQELDTKLFSSQSTDIGKALDESVKNFSEDSLAHKVIVLFTDGENLDGDTKKAVANVKEHGISVFIVGIGSEAGGKIPIFDKQGKIVDYFKDMYRQEVVTKLDQNYLKKLAGSLDGEYLLGSRISLDKIKKSIDAVEKSPFDFRTQSFLEPQFRLFILIALLALMLFLFLPDQRWSKKMLMLAVLLFSSNAYGLGEESSAYKSYKKNEFSTALRFYQRSIAKNPKNIKAKFGEGSALYKLERSERAEKSFLALTNSENKKLAAQSIFNAANARAQGENLKEALDLYKKVMQENPVKSKLYKQALTNYLYVQAKQQAQQQDKSNQKNDKKNDQKNDQNNDAQNEQDSQGETEENQDQQQNKTGEDTQSDNSDQQQNQEGQTGQDSEKKDAPIQSVSPNDVDNLLGIAEEEEKVNFDRENKKDKKGLFQQNKW